jgi:hypothetical protein
MFEYGFINDILLEIHKATGIGLFTLRNTLRILVIVMALPVLVYTLLNLIKYAQSLIGRTISKHNNDED